MKRRKIIGLVLLIGTISYLLVSIFVFYQKQRVKMEKGIEEALKIYSSKENIKVEELNKDFNLLLDKKLDTDYFRQQIIKYEGSFTEMESSVHNVMNEMADVDYDMNYLNERIGLVENNYEALYEIVLNMNALQNEKTKEIDYKISNMESDITEVKNSIKKVQSDMTEVNESIEKIKKELLRADSNIESIKSEMLEVNNKITAIEDENIEIKKRILEMEASMSETDTEQNETIKLIQEQIVKYEERLAQLLKENILYYQFEDDSQTLNLYGKKEEQISNE